MGKNHLVLVNIDGQEIQVPQGITMIEAAEIAGKEVPHYCYHPKLSVAGNCRMCLVEMGMPIKDRSSGALILDELGKPKIGWMPKPAIACNSKVSPGLHIKTNSAKVKDCRNGVMEFLLVNHPLDCPICDQAGECRLQEFASDYGRGYSRFIEDKNVKPKRTRIGPRVMLDDERCILCSRCVRFCDEVVDDPVLGFIDRGSYSTLTCYPGKQLENNYSLNTVDICPVGALTSTDFRFKMRVWFLKKTPSICTESSTGVNTIVWSREGKIYRITPRRNDEVNDTWMPDSGRQLHRVTELENRVNQYRVSGKVSNAQETIEKVVALLKAGKVGYIISGHSSLEEQFLMGKIIKCIPGAIGMIAQQQEEDTILISKDATPNLRGTLVLGLLKSPPAPKLSHIGNKIDLGEIKTLFVNEDDLLAGGLTEKQLEKVQIIYLGSRKNHTSKFADIVLPGVTVFEKYGTFINQQFRIQKFEAAIPPPNPLVDNRVSLVKILKWLLPENDPSSCEINSLWNEISASVKALEGIHYSKLSEFGIVINQENWEKDPFCEGKSLHYSPVNTRK